MNCVTRLANTGTLTISEFYHPRGQEHTDPVAERANSFSISFVESGNFSVLVDKNSWSLDSTALFITRPALVFRCSHHAVIPSDVCLSIDYADPELTSSTLRQLSPVTPASNYVRYLGVLIRRAIAAVNLLTVDELAYQLLQGIIATSARTASPPFRQSQLHWYAKRIEAVRELLQHDFSQEHRLNDLALRAGMSPFHFARVFHELVGYPLHQYLIQLRIAKACDYLQSGMSVTEACFAVGFANLGHFSRSFARRTGVLPSRWNTSRPLRERDRRPNPCQRQSN